MGEILFSGWCFVFELDQCFAKVAWHVCMEFSIFIVPLNGDTNVFCCFSVNCDLVLCFQHID